MSPDDAQSYLFNSSGSALGNAVGPGGGNGLSTNAIFPYLRQVLQEMQMDNNRMYLAIIVLKALSTTLDYKTVVREWQTMSPQAQITSMVQLQQTDFSVQTT